MSTQAYMYTCGFQYESKEGFYWGQGFFVDILGMGVGYSEGYKMFIIVRGMIVYELLVLDNSVICDFLLIK